jgi:hypothetical protein
LWIGLRTGRVGVPIRRHQRGEKVLCGDREDLKEVTGEMIAKMDTNEAKVTKQEEILAEISARIDKVLTKCEKELNLVR